ncbi:hypothetical protein RhiirA4_515373 [Rhizophagus irregularis]|uniref:Uncharacterized protein n=1 Tax=Rhizophagus irregularis TaxID=588596 RepID=A0A2I1HKS1_9GLOM|nr:hypothetical protein RhiirA4_515373 [Rhizophagus irregularis]
MANNTKTLAQIYGLFLYRKKDIIAIQEKLGIELVGDLISIQEYLNINGNPVLEVEYQSNEASTDISLGEIFNLLMYLEDDIIAIQEELGIVGYSNQERAEEADKNARVYLQKFEEFHGPLEDVPSVLIQKFINRSKFFRAGDHAKRLSAHSRLTRLFRLKARRFRIGTVIFIKINMNIWI